MSQQYRPLSDKDLVQLATRGDSAAAEFLLGRWRLPTHNVGAVASEWGRLKFPSVTAARKIANTLTKDAPCSG